MTFTSFEFAVFFVFVLVGRALFREFAVVKWIFLLSSLFFSLFSSVSSAVVVLFITIVDFSIGRKLGKTEDEGITRNY